MSHTSLGTRRTGLVAVLLLPSTVGTACTRQDDAVGERGAAPRMQVLRDKVTAPNHLVQPCGAIRPQRDGTDLRALRGTLHREPVRHEAAVLRPDPAHTPVDGDGESDPGEPRATTGSAGTYALNGLEPAVHYVPIVVPPDGATVGRGTIRQRPW